MKETTKNGIILAPYTDLRFVGTRDVDVPDMSKKNIAYWYIIFVLVRE